MTFDIGERLMTMTTDAAPLSDSSEVLPTRLVAHEALSRPYEYTLTVASVAESPPKAEDVLGRQVIIHVKPGMENQDRYFAGYVASMKRGDHDSRGISRFILELRPKLWFLKHKKDSRIFQKQQNVAVVKEVLGDAGITYELKGQGDLAKHEWIVQYQETDFSFVSRLLEEEGLSYYFTHSSSGEKVVIANDSVGYSQYGGRPLSLFSTTSLARGWADFEPLQSWSRREQFVPSSLKTNDYFYEESNTNLEKQGKGALKQFGALSAKSTLYEHPGRYTKPNEAKKIADARMEEIEFEHQVISGSSFSTRFSPGVKFSVDREMEDDENCRDGLLISVRHEISDGAGVNEEPVSYANHFDCVPSATKIRPQRITPRPVIRGPMTAVVHSGTPEDRFGTLKVVFHWDSNKTPSRVARVAQTWAGKGWGTWFWPREGSEVLVDFIEGDPERPIITGCVYNDVNTPPYAMPSNRTKSGIVSRSWGSGSEDAANELHFDDDPGKEKILLHAQKDLVEEVENDRSVTVTNNDDLTVENGDLKIDVSKGSAILSASRRIELKVGSNSVVIDTSSITLKCGASTLTLNATGAEMKGTNVTVKGSAMGTLDGGGMLTVKGGIVNIN